MLTKGDLSAIQKMFDTSKKETNDRFSNIDERFEAIDKRFDDFSDKLQKNTEDLVELITAGFKETNKAIERLNKHDKIIDNHEHRLNRVEDKIFA